MTPVESDEEDLTRKERREQARSERKALEEAEAAIAVRRRRLTQLGSVITVVIVAVVVIVLATGGGSSKAPPASGSKGETEAIAAVNTVVGGVPQEANVLGSSTAPVTMVYWGDLECPVCREFTLGALPVLVAQWVHSGKLRIEYRSLETATKESETFKTQQVAMLAAGKQNKAWYYIELFYHEQGEENSGYVTESFLQGLARQVPGLDFAKWTSDRGNAAFASQIGTDAQVANNLGFSGTPSFQIGRTGGALKKFEYTSLTEAGSFNSAIEALVKA